MNKKIICWIFIICIVNAIPACKNRTGNVVASQIYYDYRIEGNEDDNQVTCRLQFRMGGPNGATLVVSPTGKVLLDGRELPVDSAGFTGAFYEQTSPVEEFKGHHIISFYYPGEDPIKEEFDFVPFRLAKEPPDEIGMNDLALDLTDFPDAQTPVHLVITDTAYQTTDINQTVDVKNARLIITKDMLARLKSGPVTIEITREENKNLEKLSKAGGRLLISYGLKRDLNLNP
ncbi:MAG TPA: hypothetical protein VNS32_14155 [Flavisolibacter sp.]|nr:hypothetical protein [Flavisolibacter sp.]